MHQTRVVRQAAVGEGHLRTCGGANFRWVTCPEIEPFGGKKLACYCWIYVLFILFLGYAYLFSNVAFIWMVYIYMIPWSVITPPPPNGMGGYGVGSPVHPPRTTGGRDLYTAYIAYTIYTIYTIYIINTFYCTIYTIYTTTNHPLHTTGGEGSIYNIYIYIYVAYTIYTIYTLNTRICIYIIYNIYIHTYIIYPMYIPP